MTLDMTNADECVLYLQMYKGNCILNHFCYLTSIVSITVLALKHSNLLVLVADVIFQVECIEFLAISIDRRPARYTAS